MVDMEIDLKEKETNIYYCLDPFNQISKKYLQLVFSLLIKLTSSFSFRD